MFDSDANVTFADNDLVDGPHLFVSSAGDTAAIRGNRIRGTLDRAVGVFGVTTMTLEDNTIEGAGGDGITVGWESANGHDPIIRNNEIVGSAVGIHMKIGAKPEVSGNRLLDNGIGIFSAGDQGSYVSNTLEGNDVGLKVAGSPTLDGNHVVGGDVGVHLSAPRSNPAATGNTVCDNEQNLLNDSRDFEAPDDSNTICADTPPE